MPKAVIRKTSLAVPKTIEFWESSSRAPLVFASSCIASSSALSVNIRPKRASWTLPFSDMFEREIHLIQDAR